MIGVIAQLGERLNGIQEVGGSIPLNSTILISNIINFQKIPQRFVLAVFKVSPFTRL